MRRWLLSVLAVLPLLAAATLIGPTPVAGAAGAKLKVCPTCTYTTIQAAITTASSGDTIQIAPGTYSGPLTIDKSVTLRGAGEDQTTVSGGGPVLTITGSGVSVTVKGITITGGSSSGNGGGIANLQSSLTLDGSGVVGNSVGNRYAYGAGGGIYNTGTVRLHDCSVSNNSAQDEGGGIDNEGGTVSITNCWVEDGAAVGGGIYSSGGTVTLHKSFLEDNDASTGTPLGVVNGDGGGIYLSGGTITLVHTILSSNSAGEGGGIFVASGMAVVLHSPVSFNIASGLLHNTAAGTYVKDGGMGGGILVSSGMLRISNSSVTDNTATFPSEYCPPCTLGVSPAGGGIDNTGTMSLQNSPVTGNSASPDGTGGGIYNTGVLTLKESPVTSNSPDNCAPSACPP